MLILPTVCYIHGIHARDILSFSMMNTVSRSVTQITVYVQVNENDKNMTSENEINKKAYTLHISATLPSRRK